jgi:hypothetical protein
MVRFLIGLFLEGLIAGAVLRALLPGEQDWSIGKTIGVGLVSWFLLGIILRIIFGALAALVLPLLILGGAYLYFVGRRGGAQRRH